MKKLLNLSIIILDILVLYICFFIPDHEVIIAGASGLNDINLFGLIFGSIFVYLNLSSIKNDDLQQSVVSAYALFVISLINWVFILIGLTVNSSSLLSGNVDKVKSMGMSVVAKATEGAYYLIIVSILLLILVLLRKKILLK